MKSKILIILFTFSMFGFNACSQDSNGKVEIIVSYERQGGRGSNQFAIWIEDSNEKLVKTLYVTNFTADGGYNKRPGCTPLWVEKANAKELTKEQIDAFSGATPLTGKQIYNWDLTDTQGKKMPAGEYIYMVQGTLYGESQVLFKGKITIGGKKELNVEAFPEFSSDDVMNRDMIKSVKAKYILL